MEDTKWLLDQIDQLQTACPDYKTRALLEATKLLVQEENLRILQHQGELEGNLWSPGEW